MAVGSQRGGAGVRRVLFLPGVSGAGRFWQPVADALPAGWEKRQLDWPGLGDIPASSRVESFEDLTALVVAELDRPAVIVAQSMGGVIAVKVALRTPASVTGLILCATSGGADVSKFDAADWRPGYRASYPNAPAWLYEPLPDMSERLGELTIPTLLIWPTRDPISPLAVGQHLAQVLPNATLVSFDSDDHWVARSRAQEVAQAIKTYLESLRGDGQ